ncbi:MAG: hypothetical protein J6V72_14890 [Kiritimatiellae bacterium]|nr:hypothetical protein [Kiritimatiellia bacterium]
MAKKEAARRRGNCKRAKSRPGRTQESIARDFNEFSHVAGIIIGIAFGVMLFIGILAG